MNTKVKAGKAANVETINFEKMFNGLNKDRKQVENTLNNHAITFLNVTLPDNRKQWIDCLENLSGLKFEKNETNESKIEKLCNTVIKNYKLISVEGSLCKIKQHVIKSEIITIAADGTKTINPTRTTVGYWVEGANVVEKRKDGRPLKYGQIISGDSFYKALFNQFKTKQNNLTIGDYFMIIEKQQNGSILITDIINEQFIKKVYYVTTLTDAKKDFKAYAKQVKQNWFEHLAR